MRMLIYSCRPLLSSQFILSSFHRVQSHSSLSPSSLLWCLITELSPSPSTTPCRQCDDGRLPNQLPPRSSTPAPPSLPPSRCYKYPVSVSHRLDISVASPTASLPPPPFASLLKLINRPHTFSPPPLWPLTP